MKPRFPSIRPSLSLALLTLAALNACSSYVAQPAASPRVIPLSEYVASLRTVEAVVAGSPQRFLFDTGGGGTLLTPNVAAAAGCAAFGQFVGFRHDGTKLTLPRCGPVAMSFGGLPPRRLEAAIFDLMSLLEGAPEVGGVAALSTFEGETLTLDWQAGTLTVETAASQRERIRGMKPLRVRASRQASGAALDLMVAIEGEHGTLWFELDSGSVAPVLVAPHAAKELGLALSTSEPRKVSFPIVGLGSIELPALEKEMIYDGLLNIEFLKQVVITLDLKHIAAWGQRLRG